MPTGSERLIAKLRDRLELSGLTLLGGFSLTPEDDLPTLADGKPAAALVLIGNVGSSLWGPFDPESQSGPDPLNRWTEHTLAPLANEVGGKALYPFVEPGQRHWPFQQWVMRTGIASPSPIGILIQPDYGLWFALRAAFLLPGNIDWPAQETVSPCGACADKPCLSACPVNAFAEETYDVPACRSYLRETPGNDCMTRSCRARRACPVGQEYTYLPAHATFHMKAFV